MKRILVITCALLSGAIAHAQSFTGKVDTSFGGSGYLYYVHNAGSTDLTATKLLAQEDGGILMIAAPRVNYANPGFIGKTSYVYRLQPDGTKDPNFGDPSTPGIQRIGGNRSGVTDDVRLYTGAITSDKKILVAGYHNNASGGINNTYNLIVMRLHSDGKVDSSFGTNGFVSHNLKPFTLQLNHDFYAMVLQKDGKIILAGEREAGFPTSAAMVCRLHPDGRIDSSFNGIGFQSELYMERRGTIRTSVALQSDERIVVCGSHERQFGADESLSLTRLTTGGIVDSSFGTYGRFNAHYLLNSKEFPVNGYDIQVLPDDRIVAGGIMQFYQANYHRYASGLVRILKDSDEDTSFKPHLSDPTNHGLQWYHSNVNTAQDEAPDESIYRILIDDDSSMLLVGASRDQLDYGMIARLDYQGRRDSSFGTNAYFFWGIDSANARTWFKDAVIQKGTGRLIVCGENDSTGVWGVFVAGFAYKDSTAGGGNNPEDPEHPEDPELVAQLQNTSPITVSPNPFSDELYLQHVNPAEKITVLIWDITGRLLWQEDLHGADSYRIRPDLGAQKNTYAPILLQVQTVAGKTSYILTRQ